MGAQFDGYLSAVDDDRAKLGKSAKVGQSTDTAERDAWVTKYCQAHPPDLLWAAAGALVDELVKAGR